MESNKKYVWWKQEKMLFYRKMKQTKHNNNCFSLVAY